MGCPTPIATEYQTPRTRVLTTVTGTYGGSSGTNDADNDGIPDGTDPTPYGEGSNGGTDNGNGEGGTDDGSSSGGGGTSGTGSGTSTGSGTGTVGTFTPYDWRQRCIDTGGRWNGRWCVYAGEVLGDCYIDHMHLADQDPANGPGEELEPDIVGDHCRYLEGRWYPHE